MQAVSQTIDVNNQSFKMVFPDNFTAKRVQVIVLPANDNDFEVPQYQHEEVNKYFNQYFSNSEMTSFTTKISNTNQVEFIFENINLPFATGTNQGYVAFKIKTKSTLVLGNTFSNLANIYFDYNFPIITNNYTTTIAVLSNQDFEFSKYFSLYPNPAKDILNIEVKNDIAISSISVYNMLGQLVLVSTSTDKTIDVSGLRTGNYFVKITTEKGSANSRFVKE
jgi:hypothetical protein